MESDPAPDTNSRTGISFFQGGTNEINLIAMHNIINYELNGQKNEEELTYHSTDAIQPTEES